MYRKLEQIKKNKKNCFVTVKLLQIIIEYIRISFIHFLLTLELHSNNIKRKTNF